MREAPWQRVESVVGIALYQSSLSVLTNTNSVSAGAGWQKVKSKIRRALTQVPNPNPNPNRRKYRSVSPLFVLLLFDFFVPLQLILFLFLSRLNTRPPTCHSSPPWPRPRLQVGVLYSLTRIRTDNNSSVPLACSSYRHRTISPWFSFLFSQAEVCDSNFALSFSGSGFNPCVCVFRLL